MLHRAHRSRRFAVTTGVRWLAVLLAAPALGGCFLAPVAQARTHVRIVYRTPPKVVAELHACREATGEATQLLTAYRVIIAQAPYGVFAVLSLIAREASYMDGLNEAFTAHQRACYGF